MNCSSRYLTFFIVLALALSGCRSINQSGQDIGIKPGMVVFSFDDGPNGDVTPGLLDVLGKYHIKAMFALLGENAEQHRDLVKRIYAEGHILINHGYSEKWACFMDDLEFRENLVRGEAAISAAIGEELNPRLYRPQGGFYRKSQENIWRAEGYTLAVGNIRIYDAVLRESDQTKAAAALLKKIDAQGGGIILLHDARDSLSRAQKELAKNPNGAFNRRWITGLVAEIIPVLIKRGYHFERLPAIE